MWRHSNLKFERWKFLSETQKFSFKVGKGPIFRRSKNLWSFEHELNTRIMAGYTLYNFDSELRLSLCLKFGENSTQTLEEEEKSKAEPSWAHAAATPPITEREFLYVPEATSQKLLAREELDAKSRGKKGPIARSVDDWVVPHNMAWPDSWLSMWRDSACPDQQCECARASVACWSRQNIWRDHLGSCATWVSSDHKG